MQASAYLGDLGGVPPHRSLVRLDLRGTGDSAVPADPASHRCDRQVDADGAFDPPVVRSALAGLSVPVLLVAGEVDVALPPSRAADHAALFPAAELVVLPDAGHFPWLDDGQAFVRAVVGAPAWTGRADTGAR